MQRNRLQPVPVAAMAVATICAVLSVGSDVSAREQGDGSVRIEYQYIETGEFDSSVGELDIGNTQSHVFMFSGDYAFSDRWTLSASLPYIKKRHEGALPHDPADLTAFPQADQSLIDDGNFHSDWQDLYVNVSFRATSGVLSLYPFVAYGVPTNDYPFFAHAAVGRNIWHVPVGVAFNYTPLFSDFTFSGDAAYVFTEKSLGVDTSHWLINLDFAYYFTPAFAPKIFFSIKHGTQGLSFPDDFDVNALNDEAWYFHDRTIKHNFINGGIGFDWVLSDNYVLSATALTMLDPEQVNTVDLGLSLGITRYFFAN